MIKKIFKKRKIKKNILKIRKKEFFQKKFEQNDYLKNKKIKKFQKKSSRYFFKKIFFTKNKIKTFSEKIIFLLKIIIFTKKHKFPNATFLVNRKTKLL